jgi:hypothetical protein
VTFELTLEAWLDASQVEKEEEHSRVWTVCAEAVAMEGWEEEQVCVGKAGRKLEKESWRQLG